MSIKEFNNNLSAKKNNRMLKNAAYKLFDSQEKMGYWCCELTQDGKSQAKQNKVHMKL